MIILAKFNNSVEVMLILLTEASNPVGLKMHVGKNNNKVMLCSCTVKEPIYVKGNIIEAVDKYVYLSKTITQMGNTDVEAAKRSGLGWNAYGKWSHILKKRETGPKVKKRLMDKYIHSVMDKIMLQSPRHFLKRD